MRWFTAPALFLLLPGCSISPYGLYRKAEWAPDEVAARVRFPESYEKGVHIEGPSVVALGAALNDFLPPGSAPRGESDVARCLALRESFRVSVWQPNDNNIFFVRFTPDLSRCAPGVFVTGGGAEYAVDAEGHILAKR
ncbi:hypothetical protein MEBOL_002309 [Melittangium boletus DSM 14713]|uniref:Uncharacterized protein n=1 Tax=Melittangium boletus DSM 14713 TaxID=1294270 RepID=A0A250ICC9_9BACT|nr:hypothetical protein MEBOL_002309 [Melittangium boletus DSM 14713]